jgi:hypothetical protein
MSTPNSNASEGSEHFLDDKSLMRFSKIVADICVESYNDYSGTKGSSYYKRSSSC